MAASSRPSALWQLTLVRWRTFYREPGAIFWTFGFPILLSLALGMAFRSRQPERVRVAVTAPRFRAALAASPALDVALLDPEVASAALRGGKLALIALPGAGDGDGAVVYRFDPTRPDSRLARALVDEAFQRAAGRADPVAIAEAHLDEPGSRYIDFLLPGLIGMNLMQSGLWGFGFVLVDLRTRKLIKRLMATPVSKGRLLFSFVVLRIAFLIVEIPILMLFARLVFGVRIHGSPLLFFGVAVLGSTTFSNFGLLIGSRAENAQTVTGLINLVSLPMLILSGVFFSTANFPSAVQPVIRYLPLTLINDSLRQVMNDGAGAGEVALAMLVLAGWAAASLALASRLFRWR